MNTKKVSVLVLVLASLGMLIASARGRAPDPLHDAALGLTYGANPMFSGDPRSNICAVAAGFSSGCFSANLGRDCIVCEFEPKMFGPGAGGPTSLGFFVAIGCNSDAFLGFCETAPGNDYFCDSPLMPNAKCRGAAIGYNKQILIAQSGY